MLLLLLPAACGDDKEPLLTIEGQWQALLPAHPNWLYEFHNGLLTQSITDFNAVISTRTYPYTERGDTIYIGGDLNNDTRKWLVTWESPNVVHIEVLNPTLFKSVEYLKRVQAQ